MTEVKVFAMRHAEPEPILDNPPIKRTDDNLARVTAAAREIEAKMGGEGRLLVCTSPDERAYQTAEALLQDAWVEQHASYLLPKAEVNLRGVALDCMDVKIREVYFSAIIKQLAGLAINLAEDDQKIGLVLVTHQDVLTQIPRVQLEAGIKTGYAEVNPFTLQI